MINKKIKELSTNLQSFINTRHNFTSPSFLNFTEAQLDSIFREIL